MTAVNQLDMYVVEALRWGSRENHSYVVGVYSGLEKATCAALAEEMWRGGKYECVVNRYETDHDEDEAEKAEFLRDCFSEDELAKLIHERLTEKDNE